MVLTIESEGGLEAVNWLISITSASFFINWMVIAVSNLRFHQALRAQNYQLFDQTYGWQSIAWPFAPVYLLVVSTILLVCLLYAAIKPLVRYSPILFDFAVAGFIC